jgi:capsid protein
MIPFAGENSTAVQWWGRGSTVDMKEDVDAMIRAIVRKWARNGS